MIKQTIQNKEQKLVIVLKSPFAWLPASQLGLQIAGPGLGFGELGAWMVSGKKQVSPGDCAPGGTLTGSVPERNQNLPKRAGESGQGWKPWKLDERKDGRER